MQIVQNVYAEVNFGDPTVNPVAKFNTIGSFTNLAVPLMMIAGGLITLCMLFYGAFTYLTSEGNPDKLKKSQAIFIYAILGLFLIVASFMLTRIIGFVLKVPMPL